MRQLLSDCSVVDLSSDTAGTYAGKVFADLGADVVKIEPPGGDAMRRRPELFVPFNTNKRSVVVTPDDAGRARLLELIGSADAVIETMDDGDLAAYGLARDRVRAEHASLVVATLSGFGTTGPYSGYRWSDLVAQLGAWMTLPQGRSTDQPVKHPRQVAMCTLGHTLAVGTLAAVIRARDSGA